MAGHGCRRGDCGMQLRLAWTLSLTLRPGHRAPGGRNTHMHRHAHAHTHTHTHTDVVHEQIKHKDVHSFSKSLYYTHVRAQQQTERTTLSSDTA